ncbi:A disintegrin and metalloproteinase with thrombospondin motifs 6-like [Stylophora pistillata]|uniref:A disintegrin and metalloproteinase with thrombospondin motifs 6-like n=1 Tax=Stylophora pistillata TaxID=50429 RepID=UPI000C052E6D|nr:A disintegrin and metalloproteinase with thrombospondin motifs 6-like [Stylophora pistillata]
MKRTKLPLTLIVVFSFLFMYIELSCARSYKDIHHLLTDDEREMIFGHPFVEYVPEFDVSHPIQVDGRGRFLSRDLANGNARRKRDLDGIKSKEPVFFKLSAFGQNLHLNVTINDELFSPNFEIEIRGNGTSEFHYEIDHCHYIGQVVPTGGTGNKVAISNCDGLHGMIRTPQDVFMVHPLPDRLKLGKNNTRAHVIHRRSLSPAHAHSLAQALEEEKRSDSWCGVEGGATVQQSDEGDDNHENSDRSFRPNKKRTIESMLVVEKEMTRFYGVSQIEKYVPTMANMAQGLLADASIGANVKYVVTKLLILQKDQPGLVISTHASSTLDNFCKWTTGQNIPDDTSPRHFDHAALFSKYNFCRNKGNVQDQGCGTILGLAQLKGMCRPDVSCTLNKDTGLGTAFTLAHETAHNLGSEHDGEGNKCSDGVYIMATRASGKVTAFDWSPCSRNYVTKFLQTQQAHCLNDNEPKSKFALPKGLPGKRYDGDAQCVRMFGAGAKVCEIPDLKAKMCVNLHCEKPDGYCSSNDEPAADGTKCGNNKWCMRGRCVSDEIKPGYQDVDGNWGAWKPWSSCYPQCGQGLSTRERKCDNPAPKRGGKLCQGNAKEYKFCNNPKCPSSFENPRNKQCKDHRHVQFQGGPYNWIYDPYYAQGSPKCVLSCATTNGDTTSFGNVKDGTPCTDQPNSGVCINGKCQKPKPGGGKPKPSGSRPKPSGSRPKPSGSRPKPSGSRPKPSDIFRGTYSKVPPADEYYVPIATIPAGARNVKIEEATASENNLRKYIWQKH